MKVRCDICKSIEEEFIQIAKFNKKQTELKVHYICESCSKFIYEKYPIKFAKSASSEGGKE